MRALVMVAFVTSNACADFVLRRDAYLRTPSHLVDLAASVLLWLFLLRVVPTRARPFLCMVHAIGIASTLACARYFRVPFDAQMAETAIHAWGDVKPVVVRSAPLVLGFVALVTGVSTYGLSRLSPRAPGPLLVVAVALAGLVSSAPSRATPELRLLDASRVLFGRGSREAEARARVGAATLPPSPSRRARLPNVLFVLGESLRADDVCSVHGGPCPTFAETDALLPNRVGFVRARSVASYTAVSLSALLTGRTQEGSRDEILRAPNLFDVVRSAKLRGTSPTVAYVSAQLESVFESKDAKSQVDVFVSAETLLGREVSDVDEVLAEDLDGKLAEAVERLVPTLPEPFFLFVHLVGTHAPYFEEASRMPYTPASHVVSFGNLGPLRNAYKNSIVAEDVRLARIVKAFLSRTEGGPRAVLFTSDHAEAFGEHAAIHHGQDLHDPQIAVPFFVDASPGAVDDVELARLRERGNRPVTHLDLVPTVMGIYGIEDSVGLASMRASLPGRNLLGPEFPRLRAVAITNCTGMFPCPVNTWGMLDEDHKVVMQAWDGEWRCESLEPVEHELAPWDDGCVKLLEASRPVFAKKPNGAPNR
jgi:glucan phosphoethanolaminetransferase (alkaline phosphatase superfamily)